MVQTNTVDKKVSDSEQIVVGNSWIIINGDIATIGLTKEAVAKVKEFLFVDLPSKGKLIKKGETYVSVESIKWSGHIESPITGDVVDVNNVLFDQPSLINKDPLTNWIVRLKIKNTSELNGLLKK